MSEARAYLADFQRRFGAVLRTPLARDGGRLEADVAGYDAELCAAIAGDARARLAVYNRQYWFRLLGVLQHEYRLTAALLGAWAFNALAAEHLQARAPRGFDLASAADGFAELVAAGAPAIVAQAARVDAAFRTVFAAPAEAAFAPGTADAPRLARARLRARRGLVVLAEEWPLVALHPRAASHDPERPLSAPAPHAGGPRWWAIVATSTGQRAVPLARLQARLIEQLQIRPLPEALAVIEGEATPAEAENLAADARRWLADSVRLGFWTGLVEP